jgi:hypothetical protein
MTIYWITPYDTPYPHGLPLFWRHEVGSLPAAVEAYLADRTGGAPCTPDQIELVRLYLAQWINAPCWTETCAPDEEMAADLQALRRDAETLATADGIHDWLMRALDLGLDPL